MTLLKRLAVLLLVAAAFGGGWLLHAVRPPAQTSAARRVLYYVDAMHPAYRSDKPGIAPDCGMPLEPVFADAPADASQADRASAPSSDAAASMPPDAIHISPERQQLAGVRFSTAEAGGGTRVIRSVGRVAADETRVGHVHTRIDGWIEKVFVNFTGDVVTEGEPMLTIYSPEMLASQQEMLLASRARDMMQANPLASAARHGDSLFEAAKRRLQLWDLGADQIDQVLRTGEPIPNITVRAPMAGFVTARNAFPNQKVTPDSDLYTITDLSHVWILADVFETDVTAIKVGATAEIRFAGGHLPPLAAHVTYIQPQVDPMTRTLPVRLDVANAGLRMKPDMFVTVEFTVAAGASVTVPGDAVLDTGDRQTVFVDLGDGYLEPRQVTIGERIGDRVAITRGLAAGERVVSSGTFLVDSESQFAAAKRGMGAPGHAHDASSEAPAAPASAPASPSSPSLGGHDHD